MEQAFPEIAHPFSRKEAQFFENCSRSAKCYNTSKEPLLVLEFWEFQKKSELLLIVTVKLLQNLGLFRQVM